MEVRVYLSIWHNIWSNAVCSSLFLDFTNIFCLLFKITVLIDLGHFKHYKI